MSNGYTFFLCALCWFSINIFGIFILEFKQWSIILGISERRLYVRF